jgi:hypothetical protein
VLGIEVNDAGKLLARRPALVSMSLSTLAARLASSNCGGASSGALQRADLVMVPAGKLEGLAGRLAAELELEVGWVESVLRSKPSLVRQDCRTLARRLRKLQEAAQSHGKWQQQWGRYGSSTVAMLLTKRDTVYNRLGFMMAARQQHVAAMSVALTMTEDGFAVRFPAYVAWRQVVEDAGSSVLNE